MPKQQLDTRSAKTSASQPSYVTLGLYAPRPARPTPDFKRLNGLGADCLLRRRTELRTRIKGRFGCIRQIGPLLRPVSLYGSGSLVAGRSASRHRMQCGSREVDFIVTPRSISGIETPLRWGFFWPSTFARRGTGSLARCWGRAGLLSDPQDESGRSFEGGR